MAGSAVVSVKRQLLALLAARLSGVQVTWGWPGDDRVERERVFFGRARVEHEPASLRAGRTYRDERGQVEVIVDVEMVGGSPEDADDRAVEIGSGVEECVADNRTVGNDAAAGVMVSAVTVQRADLLNGYSDKGSLSRLTYTVEWAARLT